MCEVFVTVVGLNYTSNVEINSINNYMYSFKRLKGGHYKIRDRGCLENKG
jgi:hypothetical protein